MQNLRKIKCRMVSYFSKKLKNSKISMFEDFPKIKKYVYVSFENCLKVKKSKKKRRKKKE